MVRRKKPRISKKVLIGVGIASALIGTYFLAGDKIKSFFKKEDDEQPPLPPIAPAIINGTIAPAPAPKGGGVQNQPKEDTGIDINKKLRIGSKGEEVKRLQFIINYIASARSTKSYTDGGKKINFPINPDGDFGNTTNIGSLFAFNTFKQNGFVTLDQARKMLAYILGYRQQQFPSSLVGTKNEKQYQDSYKSGQIDFGKQDRAKNIGAFVNPFNP